jgi:hypothetical protein
VPVQAVAIVVYEGVQAPDVTGPMDVFSEANTFLDSADRYEFLPVQKTAAIRVCTENQLHPNVVVMKPAKDGV